MAKYNGTRLGMIRAYTLGWGICLTGFLFGYDTGIVGGVLTMASYQSDFRYTDTTTVSAVSTYVNGQKVVSMQNVGAFLAAISIFWVSERLGRKKTITIACFVFVTGIILQVCPTHSLVAFYIGRFVAGMGLGSMTAVAPSYNAEMAPKEIRGKLGSGMQWLFALGVMTSYWIVYGTSQGLPQSSKQWQIPVGLQMVPPTLLGVGLLTQKESVRWLVKKNRLEEAWENLKWHRADDGPEVKAEFEEMKTGVAQELKAKEGFKKRELLEPANRYRLCLAFGIFLGQQCTGMTALAYFAPQIFSTLVGGGSQDLLITGLFGAQKFITCGAYILLVSERWGRRPTFWIAPLFMGTLFIIVCIVNKTTTTTVNGVLHINRGAGIGTVVLIFLTNSIYQFSWGPLPWAYTSEIFPNRIRELGTSVAVSTQWLFNFLFSLVTPYMVNSMGSYVFVFYAALDFIMAFLSFLFVKETKARSIEEMETIFHSKAAFDVDAARKRGASLTEERLEGLETVESEEEVVPKKGLEI